MRVWQTFAVLLLVIGLVAANSSSEDCSDSSSSSEECKDSSGNGDNGGVDNEGGEVEDGNPETGGINRCTNKEDGSVLPSYDCSMFVTCMGGREVEETCRPDGTMFDPIRNVCDHPENVVCWEGDLCAGKDDGTIVPSDNCANFIICKDGRFGEEFTCVPNGTLFDYERGVCDHPSNVICWGSEGPNTCEGRPDGALAPSMDCSKYAICEGGAIREEVSCLPDGTVFDHIREVCDFPENVECWIPESGGESNSTTASPPTRPPLDGNLPRDICQGIVIDILPHPTECTKYVVCVMGRPTVESCGEDEIFYPSIGVCGYGNTVTCEIDERWLSNYLRQHEMKPEMKLFDENK